MNIYHVHWTQDQRFGLNAVVIANGREEALKILNPREASNIVMEQIGTYVGMATVPHVICEESL